MNTGSTMAGRALAVILPICAILAGAAASVALVYFAPEAEPRDEVRPPRIVKTVAVSPTTERIAVAVDGVVIPARQVTIEPQVSGLVVRQHPALVPGGDIRAGEELIGIDRADYELALTEQETALEQAKFELAVERGRQVVASREWRLLQGDLPESETNRSLVLREPHLKRTQALIDKAQNQIAKAQLDLSRTSVPAPFNALVLDETLETGQLVDPGTPVATLVGTDEFWVQVSVPLDKLRWIRLPNAEHAGAPAKIFLQTGNGAAKPRDGQVVRLLGDLAPSGRMARLLISVPDPLGLNTEGDALPLLLESYVRVEIEAGELDDVLEVRRSALREGDRIWVVDAKSRLQIREATVVWPRRDTVLIENCLEDGETLIVSGLRAAIPGMKVAAQPEEIATAPDGGSP